MKKRMTKLNNRSIENIQIEVEEKLKTETRDRDSIHGSRRFRGGGHGCPFWYTCLDNPMDRGAWWATVHGVTRVRHNLATKPAPPQPHS